MLFTVASVGDSLLQVTPVPAPLMASTTALSDCVSPKRIVVTLGVTATPRTVGGFTATGGPAESPPPQAASTSTQGNQPIRFHIESLPPLVDEPT